MPLVKRSTKLVRGHKTIWIPCSREQYEQVVDDSEQFRRFRDQPIDATPELFPPEMGRGYGMGDRATLPGRE
jgi:hypothetical protein